MAGRSPAVQSPPFRGDIAAAKSWAAQRPNGAPEPTALHLDFIKTSEAWEVAQHSEELRRLADRERLVQESKLRRRSATRPAGVWCSAR